MFCFSWSAVSQENIVPNHSFEDYVDVPDIWYNNGKHFTEIVRFWSSPTPASPDAYGPKVHVPKHWSEKGFGAISSPYGDQFIGITVYGCNKGKPHCREYAHIRLKEPMVVGQKYEVSIHVASVSKGLRINSLAMLFTKEEIEYPLDRRLDYAPQFVVKQIVDVDDNEWVELKAEINPSTAYEFITIGNFHSDGDTKSKSIVKNSLPFAYYYFDNISIRKKKPFLDVPGSTSTFENQELRKGTKVVLDNIYFDHDRADFLSRSYEELEKLADVLKVNNTLDILIVGHTDNFGSFDYNIELSEYRAKAVVEYLINLGISSQKLSYKGMGSKEPIATNDTPKGRKKNRRVEFIIL